MATKKQNKHYQVRATRNALKRRFDFLTGKVSARKLYRWRYGDGINPSDMKEKYHEES